ncbi:procathepsin L-like [Saccostrea cucullata]|uniref:procathepsin L-like n=1 Tax=Saccostrea cuccullata TaxID=36930 RepID=UPI002ED5C739
MNGFWIIYFLAVVGGSSAQDNDVQWFDIEETQKQPKQVQILKTKAGINYQPYEQAWKEFKFLHGKTYKSVEEEIHRFEIFRENIQKVEEHNKLYHMGKTSYYQRVNQFFDLTHEEYLKCNGLNTTPIKDGVCSSFTASSNVVVPDFIDWRAKGFVRDVKDQGMCGSCWAFSATGSLEGQHYRKTGNMVSLSEQQLVDCSRFFGNDGCNGGNMINAFEYIKSVGGIETEEGYPYKHKDGDCKFNKKMVVANVTGCVVIESESESALKVAVAEVGPVSVGINALPSFMAYGGGIYDDPNCTSETLNHAVLVIGYGYNLTRTDYWIIKNSYGPAWGEEGFCRMSRNKNNQCGIASQASYPLV